MKIDENTKIIGRFHTKPSGRGLNIYNPFFEENNINALYVLFHNSNPKVLIDGFKSFNLFGAITAGFESNDELPTLLDGVDDRAKYIGRIGYLTNDNGKVIGHAQGGQGMYRTLLQVSDLNHKKIVIVGAGNIAKGLLYEFDKNKVESEITIINRTVEKAEVLKNDTKLITNVGSIETLPNVIGDVLLNLTDIGGSEEDTTYNETVVNNFTSIVDVTFEKEETNLINISKKLNKKYATGWDMFTNQGLVILEDLFKQKFDFDAFKKHVVNGLSSVVV